MEIVRNIDWVVKKLKEGKRVSWHGERTGCRLPASGWPRDMYIFLKDEYVHCFTGKTHHPDAEIFPTKISELKKKIASEAIFVDIGSVDDFIDIITS